MSVEQVVAQAVLKAGLADPRTIANLRSAYGGGKRLVSELRSMKKRLRPVSKSRSAIRKKNRNVGEKPGTSMNKTNQFRTDGYTFYNGNVFNRFELVEIPRQSATFALNTRQRDIIHLTGLKVCITVGNKVAGASDLYFNLALVSAKNRGSLGDGTDWFRSYSGEGRQKDFGDATLNAMDRHCLPINTDEHNVHFHERRLITQDKQDAESGQKVAKIWTYETYIPINRQIRFEGPDGIPETKFQLCHWAGKVGDTIAGSQTAITNAYEVDCKVVTFFREPMPVFRYA